LVHEDKLIFSADDLQDIEEVGAEFTTYLQKIQPGIQHFVSQARLSIVHVTSILETYFLFLSFIADSKVLDGCHPSVLGIAAKTGTDVGAILRCLEGGFPFQARTILRSLFEGAITTKFIFDDFEKRIEWFHDYKDYVQFLMINKKPHAILESERHYLAHRFEEIKDRYVPFADWYYKLLIELRRNDPKIPKKPSIKGLAIAAGMETDYEQMYDTLSLAIHSSPVVHHLFQNETGKYALELKFHRALAKTVIPLTVHYAHQIFELILSRVDKPLARKLILYSRWLDVIATKTCHELGLLVNVTTETHDAEFYT
jgi:hypothetical protein